MNATIKLYSEKKGEIKKFLEKYYSKNLKINNELLWSMEYHNPIEMCDLIGVLIDNNDKFKINLWASLDKDVFINITTNNATSFIKYLYERYPY